MLEKVSLLGLGGEFFIAFPHFISKNKEVMIMRLGWFLEEDNIVYSDVNEFADHFGNETGIPNFREKLEAFRENPVKEGPLEEVNEGE